MIQDLVHGHGLTAREFKNRCNSKFAGRFSMRYNRNLPAPYRMVVRLESADLLIFDRNKDGSKSYVVEEYKCNGIVLKDIKEYSIEYGDGSSVMCNGRNEVCAKMVARVTLGTDSRIGGTVFFKL